MTPMLDDLPLEYVQTNISLTKKQRDKLKELEKSTGKSMSKLIREAIDKKYPDPKPFDPIVSPNMQRLKKEEPPVMVKEDLSKEIDSISSGMSLEAFNKIFKQNI